MYHWYSTTPTMLATHTSSPTMGIAQRRRRDPRRIVTRSFSRCSSAGEKLDSRRAARGGDESRGSEGVSERSDDMAAPGA
jgi:hypothetical protein